MTRSLTAVFALGLMLSSAGLAQRGGPMPLSPGDPFPAIDVYDDAGKSFNTRSLKGKYTVIVNGCLT